jgi:DHA1 family tetracycline resistance protein-like MFS transporter
MQPQQGRKAAISFIMATITLDILAMGIVVPVLPRLVLSFEGGSIIAAAHALGVFGTAWALMQFIFSPLQGALSDRFGRRPVILMSNFGLGLDYILMALAPGLTLLFVGRVVSGICAASFSSASAYIADITPPEQRTARFGLVSVAFGFGFVVGPALGGVLGSVDPKLPFWVAAGLSLANGMFGVFVLPESLPKENRAPWRWAAANPIGALRLLRSGEGLLGLALVLLLFSLAQNALPSIAVLYTTYRYRWDQQSVGYMLAGFGVTSALVGGFLTGPVVRRLGQLRALMTGLVFGIAGFALMGLAPTGNLFLAAIPVLAFWGFINPALNGLMAREVRPDQRGQLFGANSSIMAIASLIGPSLYTESFAHFVAPGGHVHVPGAPFLIASALLGVALLTRIAPARPAPVTAVTDREAHSPS